MINHATVRRNLPLASVTARFLFTVFPVFATFNPSNYSIVTWIIDGPLFLSVKAFVAFALALLWLIVLRISVAGLGWLGLAYVGLAGLVLALPEIFFASALASSRRIGGERPRIRRNESRFYTKRLRFHHPTRPPG